MRIHHISIRKLSSLLVALLCLAVGVAEASGQCAVTPIPVGDGSTGGFSSAVDLDGDIAVIGDLSDDLLGSYSGSVKVRRFNGSVWVEEAILTASNGVSQDQFGTQVAVSGNVIAVGAAPWQIPSNPGAAYIFRYNITTSIWEEEAILTRQTPAPAIGKDFFGVNLALDGDVVVIAGTTVNGVGEDIMGAHIFFRYDPVTFAWNFEQVVTIDDEPLIAPWNPNNWLALDDDVLIAGEPRVSTTTVKGMAWFYRYDGVTWNLEEKLISPSLFPSSVNQFFGLAVDVMGDMAVIGAPHDFELPSGNTLGAVYVYEYDGANWNFTQRVVPVTTAPVNDIDFGTSVSIAGDALFVGNWSEDDPVTSAIKVGSVYHFKPEGAAWVEQGRMFAPDAMERDKFSYSMAFSGDRAIFGADRRGDVNGLGSAYIVEGVHGIGGPDCNNNAIADYCDILDATSADTNTNDIPDECECLPDTDGSGVVNVTDLLALIAGWGPNPGHVADFNNDGNVNVFDLLALLGAWGACP